MRFATLTVAIFMIAAGSAGAAPATGPMRGEIFLRANEAAAKFDVPTRQVIVRPGIEKFTVAVPGSSKRRHGVAISGGPYRNVEGVSVKPGRSSSLTVSLRPGRYTVYDPYKQNRKLGFYIKVTVLEKQGGKFALGTPCDPQEYFDPIPNTWVTDVKCGVARDLADEIDAAWTDNDFSFDPITIGEFVCTFEPFARTGLTTTCAAGDHKVVYTG